MKLHLFLLSFLLFPRTWALPTEILTGFSATPDPSISALQSLLSDSASDFSLVFLRLGRSLALAVLHIPSSQSVWVATPNRQARWSARTVLSFNGSLVLSDPGSGAFWSTESSGERLLLRDGNLQVVGASGVTWQSFDSPGDTLLVNQNFTEKMTLRSMNGIYSMKLEHGYLGLYADFNLGSSPAQLYWKRTPMEAKALVEGSGPIYAQVNSDGYLAVYQTGKPPADIIAFSTFHRPVAGTRILRLDSDGNLRAFYWNSNSTAWITDFSAVTDTCGLPSECGPAGVCDPGSGCSCLDDSAQYGPVGCSPPESGDFCGNERKFRILREEGVELAYKKLVRFDNVAEPECRRGCEENCSCWGAIYNNGSGICYTLDFPVQTVVRSGDEGKVGFFKVRRRERELGFGTEVFWGLVGGVGVLGVVVGLGGYGLWRWREKKRSSRGLLGEGLHPGPYRDLEDKEMEMCKR